ncbi:MULTISPECIES: bifunctional diguanylate cyclase/phosphodiesterase [unclassified Methylophilus]|uniref:putative bifunctional diguanylate cyclase/phosphodiesterase n=1 Tax=unclassified Methylophilus TaxID=2630143 RepID=UPI0003A0352C|nr:MULTISPECIES: GGDEF domain-containing phosphodiesterase [unclassified Methylophilus]
MNTTAESSALHAEIVGMLYSNNRRSLMAAIVVMIALLLVQWHLIDHIILTVWSSIFLVAYGIRAYLTIQYEKDLQRELHSRQWLQWFRASTCFCGLAWGLGGILLFPEADTAHQAFLIFALVGVSGAGIIIYSVDTLSTNLFSGGIVLFMIPRFLIHGSSVSLALAVLFVVYVVYVTVAGRSLATSLRENISLRIASNLDNKKVHQLAYYDFLTGLPNRRLLTDRLNQAFARCVRHQHYGAVLCLDLNNFKGLNDSKGHQAGDELLQQVAFRLQQCLRKKDTIARMGGDEFIAVLDELSTDKTEAITAAQATAEKMMAVFSQPFELQNSKYRTAPSIGICLFLGDLLKEDEVLRRADIAMYQAKKSDNLNSIQMYDEAVHPAVEMRATLENELAFALQGKQLLLYYQVQVNELQQPTGAEVLLRWQHPTLGMIPPDQFIPIAEETGEIVSIGQWVLAQACQQLKHWSQFEHTAQLKLSVNVSAIQFSQPDFVQMVKETVLASDCDASCLRLELTESLIVKNIDEVIEKINALKVLGITFSLDDFGIGQSSLSVLKRLPLDELKIDRSFIKDIVHNNYDSFIVQTIINMGKNLSHSVIAEGVEMQQQMVMLQNMGCHAFQGYLFSRPLPLHEFEASLQSAIHGGAAPSATGQRKVLRSRLS